MSITFPTPTIAALSSYSLERYVAAIFQSHGYFVRSDLSWYESTVSDPSRTVNILQADVLAYFFAPFGESRILAECKGGGTFTDYYKFSGIVTQIKPNSSFFISNNANNFDEIHRLGLSQNITVLRPSDIVSRFRLSGVQAKIRYWYWSNEVVDFLIGKDKLTAAIGATSLSEEQKNTYGEIRKYNTILSKIWTEPDVRKQANSIAQHFDDNRDFVRVMWRTQGLRKAPDTENAIAQNILCESAASVVLKTKIEYIITAVRCAISTLLSPDPNYLEAITNTTFKAVVEKMIDSIEIACRLPQFLQFWIYQFGGLLNTNGKELSVLAELLNERIETVRQYIAFLQDIFSILTSIGTISWAMDDRAGVIEFKGVPDSIRGYGIFFRQEHAIDTNAFAFKAQWLRRLKEITGY